MSVFRRTAWYYTRYRPAFPQELIERLAAAAGLGNSPSFASLQRVGDRRQEFEHTLRERLKPSYRERVPVDALLGRRAES